METEDQKNKPDTSQDWLIISIIVFWVLFVLIVTFGYLVNPNYVASHKTLRIQPFFDPGPGPLRNLKFSRPGEPPLFQKAGS